MSLLSRIEKLEPAPVAALRAMPDSVLKGRLAYLIRRWLLDPSVPAYARSDVVGYRDDLDIQHTPQDAEAAARSQRVVAYLRAECQRDRNSPMEI